MLLQQFDDSHISLVDALKVFDEYLCTAALVALPVVQSAGGAQVRQTEHIVKLFHVALVDAGDGKATGTDVIVGYEVGKDLVAHM